MFDSTRNWINENSAAATVVVVAILMTALAMMLWRGTPRSRSAAEAWFYDATAGQLFTASAAELPPIVSPDGNEAVRAHYYSCGPCTAQGRFLGFYEKLSPETKKALAAKREVMMFFSGPIKGRFYSADAKSWHEDGSDQAERIKATPHTRCPDQTAHSCLPQDEAIQPGS